MCVYLSKMEIGYIQRNSRVTENEGKIHALETDKLKRSHAQRKKELLRHVVRLAGRIKRPEEE